ncbi:MAG TPA: GNAT family N-acetyltransferase [Acidimicrobiales bacterium]|nr:GNAT family N-acetyltransferase [Acidimicrobiales bacterium]
MVDSHRLRDGTAVVARPISIRDDERLVRFHESLSPETTRLRFFSVHPHLSRRETTRFTDVDHNDREAWVALIDDEIIGVGRYERLANREEAEVAFVVADRWQGMGVGPILLRHLIDCARAVGILRFVAETLEENHHMLDMFTHTGLPITRSHDRGVVTVTLTLVALTPADSGA